MNQNYRNWDFHGKTQWRWPVRDRILWKARLEVSFVDDVLKYVGPRRCCVQAGGGGGVYPYRLKQEFDTVITFEIDPDNLECLRENLSGVEIIPKAIGNTPHGRSLVSNPNAGAGYLDGEGSIETERLDDLDLPYLDLLWLDIQGHETEAIMGGLETIRRCKPVIVLEEDDLHYTKKWGVNFRDLSKFLIDLGMMKGPLSGHDQVYLWK